MKGKLSCQTTGKFTPTQSPPSRDKHCEAKTLKNLFSHGGGIRRKDHLSHHRRKGTKSVSTLHMLETPMEERLWMSRREKYRGKLKRAERELLQTFCTCNGSMTYQLHKNWIPSAPSRSLAS